MYTALAMELGESILPFPQLSNSTGIQDHISGEVVNTSFQHCRGKVRNFRFRAKE